MSAQLGAVENEMTEQQEQVMADAVKNLRMRWVIRQQVRTVEKRWLVDLFETENERIARQDYARLVRDNPDAYFELVALLHSEVCIDFTKGNGI